MTDGEPSRFLEEIDDKFLEYITPEKPTLMANRFVDSDLFDDSPKTIRFQKPIQRKRMEFKAKKEESFIPPSKLKKVSQAKSSNTNLFDSDITVGTLVEHNRFGTGEVLSLEGNGPNKKAEIKFGTVGKKKLLLQFAKLKVIG